MKKAVFLMSVSSLIILSLLLSACTKATPTSITTAQPTATVATTTVKPPTTVPPTPSKPAVTTSVPVTTSVTATTPVANKYGGKITFEWIESAPLMGYPPTQSQPGAFYAGFCVEGLIQSSDQPYVYAPLLATSWELAQDMRSYTFKLRKGVKFSDGTDLNATAVKWNLDNAVATKRSETAAISSVEVIDDYTVRVNLTKWSSLFLGALTQGICGIISPTAFQKNGKDWANLNPIGTGPWLMTEMVQNQYTKYVKNPNYWDPKLPYLDSLTILAVKDPMTRQALLLNGDADGAREMPTNEAKNLLNTGKWVLELGAMGNFSLTFNSTDPTSAWSNPQMRMALEYALDKQSMVDALGKGFNTVSYQVINGVWQIPNNNPGTTPRKYDLTKALQLFKDAGYAKGITLTVEVGQKFMNDYVTAIQAQLAKVGIKAEINVITDAAMQERRLFASKPNDLRFERARGGPFDPLSGINTDLASTSIMYPGLRRPDGWDALLNQGLQETDPKKILAIVNQMEQKAYGEAMFIPVYIEQNINLWNTKLKNDRGGFIVFAGNDSPISISYLYWQK